MTKEHPSPVVNERKWQKESKYIKFLPYYEKLSKQADQQLADIKTGLGKSILLREFTPGCVHWSYELTDYITLHGYRFTKEEHILFVKIMYDLLCTPNAELGPLDDFCKILTTLLDKPDLLTRSDLELDWRPLYNLYELIVWKQLDSQKLLKIPKDMQGSLETLIYNCRLYFSLSSTREILNEFRPHMCPVDSGFDYALTCMNLFLPTGLPNDQSEYGYKIWLDEILYWWRNAMNKEAKDKIFQLLNRLPYRAVYDIDLNVFLPHLFSQILRSFEIPLCGRPMNALDLGMCASIIVGLMGGENKVQDYISQLLDAVESYVHPSNVGPWQYYILRFIYELAVNLTDRLHLERYHKPSWCNKVPEELKLTDEQVDRFVSSLLPCSLSGMFDTQYSAFASVCLQCLSHLSPKLVVHKVIDSMFDALDIVTEPHRLIQSLTSTITVILPFIRETGIHSSRHKIIPFITGVLPALDPNDFEKCILTIEGFKYMFKLITFVDCQDALKLRTDLNDEEKKLALASSTFESFVNQFMDKLFSIVESFSSGFGVGQSTPLNEEEVAMKENLYAVTSNLLRNCSSKIYEVAVNRLYTYTAENLFERAAASEVLGHLCAAAISSNPEQSFSRFLNLIAKKLADSVTDEMSVNDDENCSHVLWYLHLFGHVIGRCDGDIVVTERKTILKCLNLILPLKSKEVSNLLSEIIMKLLAHLTHLYPLERYDSQTSILNKPLDEHFPIRDWAKPCAIEDLKIQWHFTNDDELNFAKEILKIFLFDQLKLLETPQDMSRDEMLKSITFVFHSILGSAYLLPALDGPLVKVLDSQVGLTNYICVTSVDNTKIDIEGKNVRNFVSEKLHDLMEFILNERSSEPKCLLKISAVFYYLIFDTGSTFNEVDAKANTINAYNSLLTDRIVRNKSLQKSLHVQHVMLQHETRLVHTNNVLFTEAHSRICSDLLKLSTNRYQEVQTAAQAAFHGITIYFRYTHRLFLDDILSYLKPDPSITDDQLKGALCLLITTTDESLYICRDFLCWPKVWPAIILAQHCSEPTVITLMDLIRGITLEQVLNIVIKFEFSNTSLELAKQLWSSCKERDIPLSCIMPDESQIKKAKIEENLLNENRIKKYYDLIDILIELSKNSDLHWRHMDMVHGFITQLIRKDFRFPPEPIEMFSRLLLHDSLDTRNRGIQALSSILKIHKEKVVKVQVKVKVCEVVKMNKVEFDICLSSDPWPIKWGFRKDNAWLIYDENYLPRTEKLWNESVFIGKTCKGFYCWPNNIKICLPRNNNSLMIKSKEHLKANEIPLFECFTNEKNVQTFCNLMSLEEDENDEMDEDLYEVDILFFKGLFRTYGDSVLTHFKPIVETIISNKQCTKSEQKFVATLFIGLVSGAKQWPFEKHEELWAWLGPLMRQAMNMVLADSDKYWEACVTKIFGDRDPHMLFWMIEVLEELIQVPMDTPYNMSNRISFMHACLNQQQWRTVQVGCKCLKYLKPLLAQPYQNLRVELGKILASIFAINFANITLETKYQPENLNTFLSEILDDLSLLRKEIELHHKGDHYKDIDNPERIQAVLLLKTILNFFQYKRDMYFFDITPLASLRFMPLLCYFENDASDEELQTNCSDELYNGLAQCLLNPTMVEEVLNMCKKCVQLPWWKARRSVLKFLQVSVFSNLFQYSSEKFQSTVKNLVLSLLEDDRLEVRDSAMDTLSGLLHCKYLHIDENLLKIFLKLTTSDVIIKRHAGVLGLSAVIKSCPYSVPNYLPLVIVDLCQFKSDIQPIRSTVELTLNDFKRTHQDSWREHKDNFTEDQLFLLTKVMISPTYYV